MQVLSWSEEEKETMYNYDYLTKTWYCITSVPSHITHATKNFGDKVEVLTVNESGKPTQIRFELDDTEVNLKPLKKRVLSDEKKAIIAETMKKARNNAV